MKPAAALNLTLAQFAQRNDGAAWYCAPCTARLAMVATHTIDDWAPYTRPVDQIEAALTEESLEAFMERPTPTRQVLGLELPEGFIWHEERGVWLRPQNGRRFGAGASNRNRRQFEQRRLERGRATGDLATVVDQQLKIQRQRQAQPEKPTGKPFLTREDLPALIMCPNCCETRKIPSIRALASPRGSVLK